MYCREVSNIVLARSCSIYRCRELEKVYTFFQVCVGAPLAADHAHNHERVPLTNEPKAKHQFDFQNTRVFEMLVLTFKLPPSNDIYLIYYIFYIYSHFTSILPQPKKLPKNALLYKTFLVSFSRSNLANTNLALPFQRQNDSCCNKFKFETAWLKATPL